MIKDFKKELKKSTNTALIAAFGFIIALSWRDFITEIIEKITSLGPAQGKLLGAIIVTIISVIGILITTKLLSENEE